MKDLIKALAIFNKYYPYTSKIQCEHDRMFVYIHPNEVSDKDMDKLEKLGFIPEVVNFVSYRFGSC